MPHKKIIFALVFMSSLLLSCSSLTAKEKKDKIYYAFPKSVDSLIFEYITTFKLSSKEHFYYIVLTKKEDVYTVHIEKMNRKNAREKNTDPVYCAVFKTAHRSLIKNTIELPILLEDFDVMFIFQEYGSTTSGNYYRDIIILRHSFFIKFTLDGNIIKMGF